MEEEQMRQRERDVGRSVGSSSLRCVIGSYRISKFFFVYYELDKVFDITELFEMSLKNLNFY